MAMNIDQAINSARSILRGEAAGSVRFVASGLLALTVWTGVLMVRNLTAQSLNTLNIQQNRLNTLLTLGNEYKSLAPRARTSTGNVDVPSVFAQVSERMELGSRVNRITPDGRNLSVEINRLYDEELTELQRQLNASGVRFISAELRALPAGTERLFTLSAIIGPLS